MGFEQFSSHESDASNDANAQKSAQTFVDAEPSKAAIF
jgi:hypothetical protein